MTTIPRRLRFYPATQIPVLSADLTCVNQRFTGIIHPQYPNSIGIPVFLAMVEFRGSWGGHHRGAFRLLIQHPTKPDLTLSATDLARLNLAWSHVRKPAPGLHPWVMISWEQTVPQVPARHRYYQNEDRFQHDLVVWTNRLTYRRP